MNLRWGGLGRRAKPSPPEMQVGGGSGGCRGGEVPPTGLIQKGLSQKGLSQKGLIQEGADSEGSDSEGPYSEGFPP